VLATAAGAAVVNATGEELLWRGLFVAAFPEDLVWGWLCHDRDPPELPFHSSPPSVADPWPAGSATVPYPSRRTRGPVRYGAPP
jgi:hypothetical protein